MYASLLWYYWEDGDFSFYWLHGLNVVICKQRSVSIWNRFYSRLIEHNYSGCATDFEEFSLHFTMLGLAWNHWCKGIAILNGLSRLFIGDVRLVTKINGPFYCWLTFTISVWKSWKTITRLNQKLGIPKTKSIKKEYKIAVFVPSTYRVL